MSKLIFPHHPGARKITRLLLAVVSAALVIGIVLAGAFQGVAIWLNSENGGNWLAQRLQSVAQSAGYEVHLENFSLHGLSGLSAASLQIADEEGVFFKASNVGLGFEITPLLAGSLNIGLHIEKAVLERLPISREEDISEERAPFALPARPDIFIDEVTLEAAIDRLVLEEQVVGGGLATGVRMEHHLKLGDKALEVNGDIFLSALKDEQIPAALPNKLSYSSSAPWQSGLLNIRHFALAREGFYKLAGKGSYLSESELFDIAIEGELIRNISPKIDKTAKITASLEGMMSQFSGSAEISGKIDGEALSVIIPIEGNKENLSLAGITGSGPGMSFAGSVAIARDNYLADGRISAKFENLKLVRAFTDLPDDLTAQGALSLVLEPVNGQQALFGELEITKGSYAETLIHNATLTVSPAGGSIFDVDLSLAGQNKRGFTVKGDATADFSEKLLTIENLTASFGKGQIKASGGISGEMVDLTLEGTEIIPSQLPFLALDAANITIPQMQLNITGPLAAPLAEASARLSSAVSGRDLTLDIEAYYDDGRVSAVFGAEGQGIETLDGQVNFPAHFSIQPFDFTLAMDAPLQGSIDGNLTADALLAPYLGAGQNADGKIIINAAVGGTLSSPDFSGNASVTGASFNDELKDLHLNNINADIQFSGRDVIIADFSAEDLRSGRLSGTARMNLEEASAPVLNGNLTMINMHFPFTDQIDAVLDADLALNTTEGLYIISGTVTPERIIVTLPDQFVQSIPQLNIVEPGKEKSSLLEAFRLDILFQADDNIYVRGWGLDAELGGRLNIAGSLAEPDVRGSLNLIRGRFEEFGRSFAITRADLRFQGPIPPSPYLDILAETEVDELTAGIHITGPAKDPNLDFTSTPPRPRDEILSYILFGEDPSEISPFQALELANTIRRFTGGGRGTGFDPIQKLEDLIGLDDLSVEGIGTGSTTVGAGKYLSDDVYIELEQGTGAGSTAAKVEIEVTPNITVESKAGAQGDTGAGIFWEWDY